MREGGSRGLKSPGTRAGARSLPQVYDAAEGDRDNGGSVPSYWYKNSSDGEFIYESAIKCVWRAAISRGSRYSPILRGRYAVGSAGGL